LLYRSWAELDLKKLHNNVQTIFDYIKKDIFAVVKADAYGHGAVSVSKFLDRFPFVKKLCVATALEGRELREAGIKKDILVLGGLFREEIDIFNEYNLTPVISDFNQLENLYYLQDKGFHINFDTGMHRLGFYKDDIYKIIEKLKNNGIILEGIMSHFPSADVDEEFTEYQILEFKKIVNKFKSNGIGIKYIHLQNSAGLVYNCDICNAVRIGLAIYGEKPAENYPLNLQNIMTVKAKVISVKNLKKGDKVSYCGTFTAPKDMKIAIVSFGYADGLPRFLSNKGKFIINDEFVDIIGNVTMDMTIVDVSNLKNIKVDDEVIIIGKSENREITFGDVADLSNTISYEIMCRISKRVKRLIKY
jgi:alanine racemase